MLCVCKCCAHVRLIVFAHQAQVFMYLFTEGLLNQGKQNNNSVTVTQTFKVHSIEKTQINKILFPDHCYIIETL